MGTPNDRRIIFGSSVVPQETYSTTNTTITREEGTTAGRTGASYTDYRIDTTIGKKFGGKGSVDIKSDQTIDGWVSFLHPLDSVTDGIDNLWDQDETNWDMVTEITSSDHTLRDDVADCNFLYLRNLGTVECRIALEGDEFDILVPGGASVAMRLNSISSADVKVNTASSPTTIEYILAEEP
tara:strand:+ start:399 stop:944 length:546 start_codon:yes stop_codon:yes gene_type:complete